MFQLTHHSVDERGPAVHILRSPWRTDVREWLLQDGPMNFHITGVEALAAELRMRGADILEVQRLREYHQLELVVRDCNSLVLTFGEDTSQRAASVHA
jgi:hypothetical protein